jgi:ribosomal protein S18 acetylase RimI-like enzyme
MTDLTRHTIRTARAADYDAIAAVVNDWWGREVLPGLPRLFLDHFHSTSLIAEAEDGLSGFLVGFVSPSAPDEAYIHYVGVRPDARSQGLARALYARFFEIARAHGRHTIKAITSPINHTSIAFHRRMGFTVTGPIPAYNGPNNPFTTFTQTL